MWALRRRCVDFFFLLVGEVGEVRWVPLLCVSKFDPNIMEVEKKCRTSANFIQHL